MLKIFIDKVEVYVDVKCQCQKLRKSIEVSFKELMERDDGCNLDQNAEISGI